MIKRVLEFFAIWLATSVIIAGTIWMVGAVTLLDASWMPVKLVRLVFAINLGVGIYEQVRAWVRADG